MTQLVIWILVLVIYFLPTIVAGRYRHRNSSAIGALNLFLGWTLLGWVVALVWALTRPADLSSRDNFAVDDVALRRNALAFESNGRPPISWPHSIIIAIVIVVVAAGVWGWLQQRTVTGSADGSTASPVTSSQRVAAVGSNKRPPIRVIKPDSAPASAGQR
jgi:hypothetical protein